MDMTFYLNKSLFFLLPLTKGGWGEIESRGSLISVFFFFFFNNSNFKERDFITRVLSN